MRRLLIAAFGLLVAGQTLAVDVVDRTNIPRKQNGVMVASLTPLNYVPILPQVFIGGSGGTTTITSGSTATSGCTDTSVLISSSNLVTCNMTAGAGTARILAPGTMSGGSATSNFFNITGTMPTTMTALTWGVNLSITGAGSSSQVSGAMLLDWAAGYTGSAQSYALLVRNQNAGSALRYGVAGNATGATSSTNLGVFGGSSGGTSNVGGFFWLNNAFSAQPTLGVSAALIADNAAIAAPSFIARDNGAAISTTAAWAGIQVQDGGQPQNGLGVLTSSTMAVETAGEMRGVSHSYTWTNAQVAALAGTAGDINVATLPAKTLVRNAYVVITGAAVGPTTVTVSCGDAIAGTPFTNYIVASDAKAGANTIYGDAVAERGTSIDTEFYYVPSYTATTLVTCHFISTGANLSTVTGSTGRVILETVLLP